MQPIYLDHNATTPIDPSVLAAMSETFACIGANPASQHAAGRQARRVLEESAERILSLLGADIGHARSDRIIFTSGGTEANNLALLGLPHHGPGRLLVSSIEHPSTLGAADQLQRRGWQVERIKTLECGTIDLQDLRDRLAAPGPRPSLVSVMLGNNETGVLQPVGDVVRLCAPLAVPVHTDAIQVVGKLPLSFSQLGVTLMSVAPHKFHGPCGIGALVVRGATPVRSILYGGAQQMGSRPGTESVALVVGMRAALELWQRSWEARTEHLKRCRDELERCLTQMPQAVINGTAPRLPHTLNISFPGVDRQALLMALDLAGIACSTGSACASGSSEPSHVLQAMGLYRQRIASAIRLSVGMTTSLADMPRAADCILKAVNQLRTQNSRSNLRDATRTYERNSL
jgi:cysteine desulfurase